LESRSVERQASADYLIGDDNSYPSLAFGQFTKMAKEETKKEEGEGKSSTPKEAPPTSLPPLEGPARRKYGLVESTMQCQVISYISNLDHSSTNAPPDAPPVWLMTDEEQEKAEITNKSRMANHVEQLIKKFGK
jgi:hypothetical protein